MVIKAQIIGLEMEAGSYLFKNQLYLFPYGNS